MTRLSQARILRVSQHGSYLSAFPLDRSLPLTTSTKLFALFPLDSQLITPSCSVPRPPAQSPRTSTPLLPTIEFP
jgi:hypothetical protein